MAGKTILDLITRPVAKRIILHAGSMIIGSLVTLMVQNGWLDAVGAQALADLFTNLLNSGVDQVLQ